MCKPPLVPRCCLYSVRSSRRSDHFRIGVRVPMQQNVCHTSVIQSSIAHDKLALISSPVAGLPAIPSPALCLRCCCFEKASLLDELAQPSELLAPHQDPPRSSSLNNSTSSKPKQFENHRVRRRGSPRPVDCGTAAVLTHLVTERSLQRRSNSAALLQ